jgi:hypothetical protein
MLANIEDSVELMMDDMLKAGVDLNHPNLIQRMIKESNNIVEWMQEELGIEFRERLTQMGGHSVPRTLSTLNACESDIVEPILRKIATMNNVEVLLDTAFEKFIVSENERRVEGIRDKNRLNDHHEMLVCRKGVVIASGGFSANIQFRMVQVPSFNESVMTTNQPGATAEVLKEALKIGTMSVQLSRIQLGPWTSPDENGFGNAPFFCLGAGFPYGIIVDPHTSRRFANELGNRYERSMAILKMGHPAVCITDYAGAGHSLRKDLKEHEPVVKSLPPSKILLPNTKWTLKPWSRRSFNTIWEWQTESITLASPFAMSWSRLRRCPFMLFDSGPRCITPCGACTLTPMPTLCMLTTIPLKVSMLLEKWQEAFTAAIVSAVAPPWTVFRLVALLAAMLPRHTIPKAPSPGTLDS